MGGGRFVTVNWIVFNPTSSGQIVNAKCFNDAFQRVGAAAGVNIELNPFQQASHTPATLGITTDLLFTGLGWCYFDNGGSSQISVAISFGLSGGNPGDLLSSATSSFVASATALGYMSVEDGSVPHWTSESGWRFFLLIVNPTTINGTLRLRLYNTAGVQQGADLVRALNARDFDVIALPGAFGLTTPPTSGAVDLLTSDTSFTGWVLAFNLATSQALLYNLPLIDIETVTINSPVP